MMILVITFIITIGLYVYLWLRHRYRHWEKLRIPHLRPDSLFFGNEYDAFTGKLSLPENVLKHYKNLAGHRFGGLYQFFKPILYIRDPQLMKNILIKDFHYFYDRLPNTANKHDPLTQHLFNLTGNEWKTLRNQLSPTFTSGKMRILFGLMEDCVAELNRILEKKATNCEAVDVKDLMARYTTDVISSCAFGLKADSLQNPNSEFRKKGKEFLTPTITLRIKQILLMMNPDLFLRFLRMKVVPQHLTDFFINLVRDTMEFRTKNKIERNDFLDILTSSQEDKNGETKTYDIGFLTAQCFVFFFAGFETASNALTFALYELAKNQGIQKKLQKEVDMVFNRHDGRITYDSLHEMHYLDQVCNETFRRYPALPFLFRTCTEDYKFPDSDYIVKKGDMVIIPVYGLHQDPQYFPDPDVFNPENFSEEAKSSRPSSCFLPFGEGPRNCIGMRFGILQIKLALSMIMKNYTVTISPKMKLPIELAPHNFVISPKNEILLNFHECS